MVSSIVGGGRKDKNPSPMYLKSIPVYKITKAARRLLEDC